MQQAPINRICDETFYHSKRLRMPGVGVWGGVATRRRERTAAQKSRQQPQKKGEREEEGPLPLFALCLVVCSRRLLLCPARPAPPAPSVALDRSGLLLSLGSRSRPPCVVPLATRPRGVCLRSRRRTTKWRAAPRSVRVR